MPTNFFEKGYDLGPLKGIRILRIDEAGNNPLTLLRAIRNELPQGYDGLLLFQGNDEKFVFYDRVGSDMHAFDADKLSNTLDPFLDKLEPLYEFSSRPFDTPIGNHIDLAIGPEDSSSELEALIAAVEALRPEQPEEEDRTTNDSFDSDEEGFFEMEDDPPRRPK